MPVNNPTRTLAQIAYEEQQERQAAITAAGLPMDSAESNKARVNNTDAAGMDSQGLDGSLAARNVADESFNQNTFEAYEAYNNDILGSIEAKKASGAGGAVAYPDERAFPTNAPSSDPNR